MFVIHIFVTVIFYSWVCSAYPSFSLGQSILVSATAKKNVVTASKVKPQSKSSKGKQSAKASASTDKAKKNVVAAPKIKPQSKSSKGKQSAKASASTDKAKKNVVAAPKIKPQSKSSKGEQPAKASAGVDVINKKDTAVTPKAKSKLHPKSKLKSSTVKKSVKKSTFKRTIKKGRKSKNVKMKVRANKIQSIRQTVDFINQDFLSVLPEQRKELKQNKNKISIQRLESITNNSPESLLLLAQAYYDKGDYKNQIRILEKLVNKYKKNGLYHLELIRAFRKAYFKTAEPDYRKKTVESIHQVLRLDKKYHEPAQLEMLSLLQYKKDIEANHYAILKLLQSIISEFGNKKIYVRNLCKYLYINKFYQQSLTTCKKAIKQDPDGVDNYVYYALSIEDSTKMEQQLKWVAKKFPQSALAQLQAGEVFLKQKSYPSAVIYYRRAVRLAPNSAPARAGLAQSLFGIGQFKKSYTHFVKACVLNKSEYLWVFKQAKSMLNQQNRFSVAEFFEKGINQCFHKNTLSTIE